MGAVTDLREFASYPIRPDPETPRPFTQAQMDGAISRLREGARIFAKLLWSAEIRSELRNGQQR
jgi:hypothetical protein